MSNRLNLSYSTEIALLHTPCDAPEWFGRDMAELDLAVYVYKEKVEPFGCDRIYVGNTGLEIHIYDPQYFESIPQMHFRPNCYSDYNLPEDQKVQNIYLFAAAVTSLINWYQTEGKSTYPLLDRILVNKHAYLIKGMQRLFESYQDAFVTEMPCDYILPKVGEDRPVKYFDSYINLPIVAGVFREQDCTLLNAFSNKMKRKMDLERQIELISPRFSRNVDDRGETYYTLF